jgi:sugar transferase (PEP-CTERM system associated)
MVKSFVQHLQQSLIPLAIWEMLILLTSVYAGVNMDHATGDPFASSETLLPKAFLFAGVIVFAIFATGLYWHYRPRNLFATLVRVSVGFLMGVIALMGICYLISVPLLRSDVYLHVVQMGLVGVLLAHTIYYYRAGFYNLKRPMLVLRAGSQTSKLATIEGPNTGLTPYVHISNLDEIESKRRQPYAQRSLIDAVRNNNIREIIVALDGPQKEALINELSECNLDGTVVSDVSGFTERRLGKVDLNTSNHSAIVFADGFRITPLQSVLKRLFDVIGSMVLLVLTLPVMVLVALAILIESRGHGPVFYTQERVGQGGRLFKVIKFRSMRTDAEKSGEPQYAQENDPRVTKIGRILRDLRIDELPQLINVLRGEMSLVGPRPERPKFVQHYLSSIPYYGLRHDATPGITGWAQVSYRYGSDERDTREKLQYDLYYLTHFSLLLDLKILLRTVHVVLAGSGAR